MVITLVGIKQFEAEQVSISEIIAIRALMPECVWACIIARIYDSTLGSDYNLNIGILAVKTTEQKYLINYYCKLRELHRTAYFNDISRCLRKHLIFILA